ncbi:hypothetical protein MMC32_005316 [Xylographa parallela]|nr:hypothetical protein [Xylographa parallela]
MQLSYLLACAVALAPVVVASFEEYYPRTGVHIRESSPYDLRAALSTRNIDVKPRITEGYLRHYRRSADHSHTLSRAPRHAIKKRMPFRDSHNYGGKRPWFRRRDPGSSAKSATAPAQPKTTPAEHNPASSTRRHPFHLSTVDPGMLATVLHNSGKVSSGDGSTGFTQWKAAGGLQCDSKISKLAPWIERETSVLYSANGDPESTDNEFTTGFIGSFFKMQVGPTNATYGAVLQATYSACKLLPDPNIEGDKLFWASGEAPRNFEVSFDYGNMDDWIAANPGIAKQPMSAMVL